MSEMEMLKTQDVTYRVQSLEMGKRAPGRQQDERRGMFKKALQQQMGEAPVVVVENENVQTPQVVEESVDNVPHDKSYSTYHENGHYGDEEAVLQHRVNIVVG